jgi:hypothetical protein
MLLQDALPPIVEVLGLIRGVAQHDDDPVTEHCHAQVQSRSLTGVGERKLFEYRCNASDGLTIDVCFLALSPKR